MNENERLNFDRSIAFVMRHMGDEVSRHIRVGMDYYREIELESAVLRIDHRRLTAEVAALRSQLAQQSITNAPTEEIPAIKSSCQGERGKCRKNGLCENWEPEPQTPGLGIMKNESALIHSVEENPTDRVDIVEKKSFIRRLFGG